VHRAVPLPQAALCLRSGRVPARALLGGPGRDAGAGAIARGGFQPAASTDTLERRGFRCNVTLFLDFWLRGVSGVEAGPEVVPFLQVLFRVVARGRLPSILWA